MGKWRCRLHATAALILCLLFAALPGIAGQQHADVPLEVKIGQLLLIGFRGLEVEQTDSIMRDIRQYYLGGVVLFDRDLAAGGVQRNIRSKDQVKRLVVSLQSAAALPLLVAIDQEGGRVARLKPAQGFAPTQSHTELGRTNDVQATYAASATIAANLAEVGINLNFAPVVDLCVNPDNPVIARLERCFSAQPATVTQHALAFVQAQQVMGVTAVIKHFPGHGSSHGDSHLGFVDVTDSWVAAELSPYADLIKEQQVKAVMTAHVFHAGLDADYPATLSRPIIDGLLRKQLGFDGVVFSDDLQMAAIAEQYNLETTIRRALAAGVDVLLFGNNLQYDPDIVPKAVTIIHQLVENDVLTESRIDESYRRILRLKGFETRSASSRQVVLM